MIAVVLHPNTQTNTSDKYRVVEYENWLAYANGATQRYDFVRADTYEAAQEKADEMNRMYGQRV